MDAPVPAATPFHAAKGDDDLMSQPQAPAAECGVTPWANHVGRAQRTWPRLSAIDLAIVDGDMARLGGLLRRHYVFDDAEVERRIAAFVGGKV